MFVKSSSVCRGSGSVLFCRESLSAGFADVLRQLQFGVELGSYLSLVLRVPAPGANYLCLIVPG